MSDSSKTKKMLDPDPRIWDFETEYELGQDNIRPFGLDIHNPVFLISSIVIAGFVLISLANQEAAAAFFVSYSASKSAPSTPIAARSSPYRKGFVPARCKAVPYSLDLDGLAAIVFFEWW